MARDDDAPHGEIDWTTAAVRDGRMTVEIVGEPGDEWSARVRELAERLERAGSDWGEIALEKSKLRVTDVAEGAEADLRHLLESAVLQANAEFAPDDEEEDGDDEGSEQDRAMTAAFRAFAEPGDNEQPDAGESATPEGDAAPT